MSPRTWSPGYPDPIRNAPFAQWTIVRRPDPYKRRVVIQWPEVDETDDGFDGSNAIAWEFIGDIRLDPAKRQIQYRPAVDAKLWHVEKLFGWALKERIRGDFGAPAELTEPWETGDLGQRRPAWRCEQIGCDFQGRWHVGPDHVVAIAYTDEFVARLRFRYGSWLPEIGVHVAPSKRTKWFEARIASETRRMMQEAYRLNVLELDEQLKLTRGVLSGDRG